MIIEIAVGLTLLAVGFFGGKRVERELAKGAGKRFPWLERFRPAAEQPPPPDLSPPTYKDGMPKKPWWRRR